MSDPLSHAKELWYVFAWIILAGTVKYLHLIEKANAPFRLFLLFINIASSVLVAGFALFLHKALGMNEDWQIVFALSGAVLGRSLLDLFLISTLAALSEWADLLRIKISKALGSQDGKDS